jgi:Flp pilus assembly protein TadG
MNTSDSHPTPPSAAQRGQAIVIIALGFILLLGFTGLVVDVARVFVARGSLRRAVDAAGLAAAAQFRQATGGDLNVTLAQIQQSAEQFIYAHGIVANTQTFYDMAVITSTLRVETCDTTPGDTTLCPPLGQLRRKLVRVRAEADVSMTFLQILGIHTTRVYAESLSEAAAVDVVLVIDASASQAYDPPSMDAYNGHDELSCDLVSFNVLGQGALYGANTNACIKACNDNSTCQPFQKIKDAAIAFIDQLYPQYDRVSVIRIDRQPEVLIDLTVDLEGAKNAIRDMRVSDHYPQYTTATAPGDPCPYGTYTGSPNPGQDWKCTTANTGFALRAAGAQFGTLPFRDDSLWVVILLSSSSADATDIYESTDADTAIYGFCPGKNTEPLCRDNQWATHHPTSTIQYDAEDYAYDKAMYLGLEPGKVVTDHVPDGGLGVLMFSIGLGRKVVCTGGYTTYSVNSAGAVTCVPAPGNPYIDPNTGYPNVAESFLRYVAYIGSANELDYASRPDPCQGKPLGQQCGNYYFAPDADGLTSIFLAIAGKIFTRISG